VLFKLRIIGFGLTNFNCFFPGCKLKPTSTCPCAQE